MNYQDNKENQNKQTDKQKKGDFGEERACLYLTEKGYNITARNFRTKSGEIDIIAQNAERLVFIEVKTRKLLGMGRPSDAVDSRKRGKIIKVAQRYLLQNPTEKLIGFDIIEVVITDSINPDTVEINHFKEAFDASGGRVLFI
ncbi:MAG: YraN family protein [Oscillospiraceae bacterium]|nr:YraN family protein [Oscillospiraceae bacterium]